MTRAVLDTNVVVSALIWGGAPFGVLEAAASGQINLITSPVLLAELTDVLNGPKLNARLKRVRGSVEDAVALYTALTISVTPISVPRIVPEDPDDDHVIAAAVTGQADIIASGDRHLLRLGTYQAIRIVRPAALLTSIGTAPR
jgi:putative PIN family toxin of toxin-antitoxin system